MKKTEAEYLVEPPAIAVIGIGNLLLGDDGVGIHVIRRLQQLAKDEEKNKITQQIDYIDGGTAVFDMMHLFTQYQQIILIDCVKGGHVPGTVYRLTPQDLGERIRETSSLHEVQVLDLLSWVNQLGHQPEVTIIGVEPEIIDYSLELSEVVANSMEKAIREVRKLLLA